MDLSLVFLLALLVVVVGLNWRSFAAQFGMRPSACAWSRIPERDSAGRRAWYCPTCGREELTEGRRPPDCGAVLGRD